jgi:hypothetical protein
MEDLEQYKQARNRVIELKAFYLHLILYIVVNVTLVIFNLATSPEVLWFKWPLMGWGIGIVSHAFSVFVKGRLFGKKWEEKKIKELIEKETKTP